jgi:uncharacterized protein (TIGR00369 family)
VSRAGAEAAQPGHPSWGPARTRVLTWYDPTVFATATDLSGREFLQAIIDGRLPPPPIASLIGAEFVSVGEGVAHFRCAPDEAVYSPLGMVHGGLLCTLMDTAAGCAVHSLLPAGVGYSSIEIKVSFLKPLRQDGGAIDVHGAAIRVGTRVAFAEARATDATGELVGTATTSISLLRL